MTYDAASGTVIYRSKMHLGLKRNFQVMPGAEWLELLCKHIPDRYEQLVRYVGWYSSRSRGVRKAKGATATVTTANGAAEVLGEYASRAKAAWARLIRKVYEADPLVCRDHPLQSDALSLDEYLAAEHVVYRPSGATYDALQDTLADLNVLDRRKVVLTAAHAMGLSSVVAGSRLLLCVPARLAQTMASPRADLRIARLPFDVAPFPIKQQWHEQFHADTGHQWLRRLVFELFSDFP